MALFGPQKTQFQQVPTRSPQQMQTMNQLQNMAMPQLNQLLGFEPIAEAAQQRFQEQTLPSISERFAGMGAQRSSGRSQALANAQRDLQTQLAGQESQFNLGQQGNLANLLGLSLQPQFESVEMKSSGASNLLSQLLPLALHAGAAGLTGGASLPFSAAMYGGSGQGLEPLMQWFGG